MPSKAVPVVYFYSDSAEFTELCNFAPSPFQVDGKEFATVEHFFQSVKFSDDPLYMEKIRTAETPLEAKRLGRSRDHPMRKDWDTYRIDAMYAALSAKFAQNPALRDMLISTGDRFLAHDSPHDTYWGYAKGQGRNMLGVLMMNVRNEISTACT
jgi:ribA/ribD-fused uncharacterized protein